ncbi:hypothetical protein [Flavobacterium saccharophilum]|uniref:Uncharacterized protein n=1 Tax=Flavobacterium saccharophilum TaxID=29534 RepID=A0A1M7ATY9_9FLAO|nr:hypothetical protein [Flavobacterium saccharophilum]SHL46204.1 hypothetical protein SAMN05444366_0806 [Flavobacterium saccharophilum]
MATEKLSKETENRLIEFFTKTIDPKEMAKTIRQVNYVLSLCAIRGCETVETEFNNLEDNFYWLNKLAEVLDPYLDGE